MDDQLRAGCQFTLERAVNLGDIDADPQPQKAPLSAMRMTRLSMVASTRPSTTSVSQSRISAPLSLTSGPTISRAADGGVGIADGGRLFFRVAPGGSLTSFGSGIAPASLLPEPRTLDVLAGDVVVASGDGRFAEHGNSRG